MHFVSTKSNVPYRGNRAQSHFIKLSTFFPSVPPRWQIEPSDTNVVKGKNAMIDCDTDAYPQPVITWSRADGNACLLTHATTAILFVLACQMTLLLPTSI